MQFNFPVGVSLLSISKKTISRDSGLDIKIFSTHYQFTFSAMIPEIRTSIFLWNVQVAEIYPF